MKKNNTILIFLHLMKRTLIAKAIIAYIVIFLSIAAVMAIVEPSIKRYIDGVWYAFVSCSTIGFGDFAAETPIGRMATAVLYVFTVLILALITAFFTQFFIECVKSRNDITIAEFGHDMEHLEDLPRERLAELSKKIRELRS